MTRLKRRGGFTLTEVIIALAILLIVVVSAGAVFMSAMQSFALNKQLQDDQYNVRMALVALSQDAHKSREADVTGGVLTLSGGAETVTYTVVNGELLRNGAALTEEGALDAMTATVSGKRLTVTIEGRHNLTLTTEVMLSRVPE
jgi:prepilin-type N-terminal cleavage/methylation domain-containing protein